MTVRRFPLTCPRLPALLVLLLAMSLPGAACGKNAAESGQVSGEVIGVTVQPARLASLRDVVTAAGTVVPSPVGDFIVTASEPSEIVELPKNEGDTVQTGDVLVRLEVPSVVNEIATRQLELSEASARVDRARADEARLGKLFAQGLAARIQWDATRATLAAAETNLNQVRTRLDSAKAQESGSVVRARFPGVVIKRWHVPGDLVAAGNTDPILRVIDPARLQVALPVPLADAARILAGQTASVQTGAAAEAALVVQKIAPTDATATTVEVRLTFLAPSTAPIDSAVQAEIVVEERQNVLVVPAAAVQRTDTAAFVWVATDTAQATRREVRTGLSATGLTQILSGLAAGDQVILTAISLLTEGATIMIAK